MFDSSSENMKMLGKPDLFSQVSEKNIKVFNTKTKNLMSKTAVYHPTHIHLSRTTHQIQIIG